MGKRQNITKKELLEILEIIKKYSETGWCAIMTEKLTINTGVISFKSINGVEHKKDYLKIIKFFKEESNQ